jgi:pimeloyl-ACP methyl ester carboxylesterase
MVSFDFAACGASEGEFITLGYNEREDVHFVIGHLKKELKVKNIILWGRSMGAATALLYTAKYGGINAVISDNSYSDL